MVASVFDATRADIEDAVRAGLAKLEDEEDTDDGREPILLSKGVDRLTHGEAVEFRKRLQALYAEFGRHSDAARTRKAGRGAAEERRPFGLVLSFYPLADAGPTPGRQPRRPRRSTVAGPDR
jgi:hypothetical protein